MGFEAAKTFAEIGYNVILGILYFVDLPLFLAENETSCQIQGTRGGSQTSDCSKFECQREVLQRGGVSARRFRP